MSRRREQRRERQRGDIGPHRVLLHAGGAGPTQHAHCLLWPLWWPCMILLQVSRLTWRMVHAGVRQTVQVHA